MKFIEKNPMIMIVVGVFGISLSSIFVKFSTAPSAVTAAYRLMWTVLILTPVVFSKKETRKELKSLSKKSVVLSIVSGAFLALHFVLWFESLSHTSVASSTTIVCTEVIWVALGYLFVLKGKLGVKPVVAILITLAGSVLIAYSDSGGETGLYGDVLALLAAVAVAVYTLIGGVVREKVSTTVYTYIVYVSCMVVLLATCLIQGHNIFGFGISAPVVGLLLSLFSTILGHSIFSWCLKYFSPSFVSASKLCEPVVSAIIAMFIFAEIPTFLQIAGAVLVLSGVLFYSFVEKKKG
ncbi:MAG: DMT family transporter [Clostridia bacterium]|nr:DMT family transporter [Clostridia bacterium]